MLVLPSGTTVLYNFTCWIIRDVSPAAEAAMSMDKTLNFTA